MALNLKSRWVQNMCEKPTPAIVKKSGRISSKSINSLELNEYTAIKGFRRISYYRILRDKWIEVCDLC